MVIIGSLALSRHIKDIGWRDHDFVATYDEAVAHAKAIKATVFYPINSGKSVFMKSETGYIAEIEIAWEGSRAEKLIEFVEEQGDTVLSPEGIKIPSLDVLYMLKMSHRYLKDSPFFLKTMQDIHLMRKAGAKIRPEHQEFYEQRMKDTYTNKLPSLMRSKGDFFSGDGIVYEWEHDDIHEAVKHLDKPAYQYFSRGEVWSDMKEFQTLPEEIKLYAVLEESLVLAAERSQLAFPDQSIPPKWSFDMALSKVCTSITGGVFREYSWEAYYKVQELYDKVGFNYMDRVREGVSRGVIKRVR